MHSGQKQSRFFITNVNTEPYRTGDYVFLQGNINKSG